MRIFGDLKERHPRTAFAQQGGLIAGTALFEKGRLDDARAALGWVADQASQDEYRQIAALRLAGVLLDQKQPDEALKRLDGIGAGPFAALAADRRGDVLVSQGNREEAVAAYRKAWDAMEPTIDYRRLVEAKLVALGASPKPAVPAPTAAGASAVPAASAAATPAASAASQ